MSFVRPLLNTWLRWTEKTFLAKVDDPLEIRRGFEQKSRLFFHGPRSVGVTDIALGGRPALALKPQQHDDTVILYFHGGGYVFGSPGTHKAMIAWLCREAQVSAILPDYRKAPEDPFPAAFDDAVAVWEALLNQGVDPSRVILGGDSAGGGLALALLAHLLEKGRDLPAASFAFSPLTDMTFSGRSFRAHAEAEVMLPAERAEELAQLYLAGHDPRDQRVSPLFASFKGSTPVFLTVGGTEILFDDTTRLMLQMDDEGVSVTLALADDLPHVWPIFHNTLPEARATLRSLAGWIRQQTGRTDGS